MRMRKWRVITAVTACSIFAVANVVHEFITNDPIGYFSAEPHRLLYVAAIAIVGGLGVFGFHRLSPRAQWHVRVFSWGAAASTMTVAVCYALFGFLSLFSFIVEAGGTIWIFVVLLLLLLFSGIAAYFWYEFRQVWKTGVSQ
jgi:hypothetical protein